MKTGGERISVRLVMGLTALFLFCLWAFVVYWSLRARDIELENSRNTLGRLSVAVEEQSRSVFKLAAVFLDTADLWLANHPESDPLTDSQFAALVEGFYRASGGAIQLRVVTRQGALYRIPSDGAGPRAMVADRDYFLAARSEAGGGQPFIGMPVLSRVDGQWVIPLSQRLQKPRGDVTTLLTAVRIDRFLEIFDDERVYPNGAITLLRRDGMILVRSPGTPDMVGKSALGSDIFSLHLPLAPRGVVVAGLEPADSKPMLVAYAALDEFPLVAVVAAAREDVLSRWWLDVWVIGLAGLAVTLLALLASGRLVWLLQQQERIQGELFRLATTDPLTGCLNRRQFMDMLAQEFARSQRHGHHLTLMALDLDFFKRINDGYGHAVGDQALKSFVATAHFTLRQTDYLGRLGGEEFAILLPETDMDQASRVAERLRHEVAQICIDTPLGHVQFTVSIGLARFQPGFGTSDELLCEADRALYQAKSSGRNRVVQAEGPGDPAPVFPPG